MPYYYSASRTPIEVEVAPDDIGMRFAGERGPQDAERAAALIRGGARRASPIRQFHRFLMLHDANAASLPVGSIASALPQRFAARVERPLPVLIEKRSR